MKRIATILMGLAMSAVALQAKTLVVYYSFTNNCRTIANDVRSQLADADLVEVRPAEEGLDYAANNYAIGSAQIAAIRNHPDAAGSYPAIKPVNVDFGKYDEVVVATPLWWSNMAAPMQTFLFQNGDKMAGKRIGLIVSSASSGISDVVADANRLVPKGKFCSSNLWIRSSQTGNCHKMIADWIKSEGIGNVSDGIADASAAYSPAITVNDNMLRVDGEFDYLRLFDAAGRMLLSSSDRATDISGLQAEVCIVQVNSGRQSVSYKLVVKPSFSLR